ncbi:hypothetical protein SETIT_6G126200v2 [Setaria italica]|uniref:Uncharacterized protein n=2 Tax=Setaria italica TaxID=4555 RepID=A0A368RL70_SETIT|nr:UPF0481 protein At3g47200 isoform X1 [Setaria italica]RCV30818.1 hypothetical protein SETIT_6G126200v2 [Setaria italica]
MDNQEQEVDSTFHSLIEDMKDKLNRPPAPATEAPPPACLISWVNEQIREAKPGEYMPLHVPIGPFHRDPSHWMQHWKRHLLYRALPGAGEQQREQALRRYLEAMAAVEVRARRCYDGTFSGIDSEAFACMLLLDGYFVLSCFELAGSNTGGDAGGHGSQESRPREFEAYRRDVIFLLENQVPLFVLEDIHRLVVTYGENDNSSVVVQGIASHIEKRLLQLMMLHDTVTYRTVMPNFRGESPCHLLHLLYEYFRPADRRRRSRSGQPNCSRTAAVAHVAVPVVTKPRWRSATYYYAAGVRFAKRKLDGNEVRSILDVDVKDGTLHVPCLMVDANAMTILRNMVALEQHNPGIGSRHVTAYCFFLSQVASTEEDVRLLSSKGIIEHGLRTDSAVANGFAGLCTGVALNMTNPDSYLKPIQDDLEVLCQSRWRKSMAWLRHTKCNNILMALAVLGAVILFVCTVEQSLFAALSYAKGK